MSKQQSALRMLRQLAAIRRGGLKLLDTPRFAGYETHEEPTIGSFDRVMGVRGKGSRQRYFRRPDDAPQDDLAAFDQLVFALTSVDYLVPLLAHVRKHDQAKTDELFWRSLALGNAVAQAGIVLTNPTYGSGRQRIEHAESMREEKARRDVGRRREKRQAAEAAMAWARYTFPTAAHDDFIGFLKDKAAEHLEVSRDTIDRWLAYTD